MSTDRGFTRIELLVVIALFVILVAVALPGHLQVQRADGERTASTSLKTLATVEADFRANDRDNNKINDFWTSDVTGFYELAPAEGKKLRLVELSVAYSDAHPRPDLEGAKYALVPETIFSPKSGYWCQALLEHEIEGKVRELYNSDRKSGFGFVAYPQDARTSLFMINDNNTLFRRTWADFPKTFVKSGLEPQKGAKPPAVVLASALSYYPLDEKMEAVKAEPIAWVESKTVPKAMLVWHSKSDKAEPLLVVSWKARSKGSPEEFQKNCLQYWEGTKETLRIASYLVQPRGSEYRYQMVVIQTIGDLVIYYAFEMAIREVDGKAAIYIDHITAKFKNDPTLTPKMEEEDRTTRVGEIRKALKDLEGRNKDLEIFY